MDFLTAQHVGFVECIRTEIIDMSSALVGLDYSARVPNCPDWDLAELVRHTGQVHRWVTRIIETAATERVRFSDVEMDLPKSDAGLAKWLAEGGDHLISALSEIEASTPVWTFGGERPAVWWSRRMLHETTVHRVDAQQSQGEEWSFVDVEIAFDGIQEMLDEMLPATGAADRIRALNRVGDSLHLHALDANAEWTISLSEGGFEYTKEHTKATVAARACLGDLYLLLWNRRKLHEADHFEVFGDPYLFGAWSKATTI